MVTSDLYLGLCLSLPHAAAHLISMFSTDRSVDDADGFDSPSKASQAGE